MRTDRLAALLVPLALPACAAGGEHADSRVDSAGIEIVTSSAVDLPAPWRLTRVGTFGGEVNDTLFVSAADRLYLAAGSNRFFILDSKAPRVVVLDTAGRLVSAFGRAGDGPGELRDPLALSVAGDNEVTLLDMTRRRLITFTASGDTLGDAPISAEHVGTFGLGHLGSDLVMEKRYRDSVGTAMDVMVVGRGDSGVLARYRSPEARSVVFESCGVVMTLPPLFMPRLQWSSAGDWLAVTSTAEYDVAVYHVGSMPRRVRRALPQHQGGQAAARAFLGEGWELDRGDTKCLIPPDEVIAKQGVADRLPAVRRVMIDSDGWLRVQRFSVGDDPALVDVFSPDGEYVGTMTGEHPMPDAAAGNYVATAVDDSLGLPSIVISRIEGRDN